MSFIDRCPECGHRICWRLPGENGIQCPACNAALVERRRHKGMGRWGLRLGLFSQIFLGLIILGDSIFHGWGAAIIVSLFVFLLICSLVLLIYANFFEARYESVSESVK